MRPCAPRFATPVLLAALCAAGCGSAGRGPAGGPTTLITAEDIARYPGEPIEKIIERKVPGVVATMASDGSLALRIRGVSSWDGTETPPLYVVNNVPLTAGTRNALAGINPYDIETVRVLKGAEAAIYGIDGANGVIVVSTKRAGRRKQPPHRQS